MREIICPHCKILFETKYASDIYCSADCKKKFHDMDYVKRWADRGDKKKSIPQDHQAFTIRPKSHRKPV